MQIIRTIVWVLLLVALGIFSWANWDPRITVYIWEGFVVDTRLPAIVIVSWAVGFVPVWLLHRASKWQFRRRVSTLEAAMRNAAAATAALSPSEPAPVPVAGPALDAIDDADLSHPAPEESKPILP